MDLKVVLLPELHQLDPYAFEREYGQVVSFLRENGIAAFDLAAYFKAEPNPQELWVSRDDAHPNSRAHDLIAEYAFDFISE
jgi:hypothetical protein